MATSILRLPTVKARTGLARSTIYLKIGDGLFPRPVALGARAVGWPDHEIEAIIAARIAGRDDNEIRQLVAKLQRDRGAPRIAAARNLLRNLTETTSQ